ncbi:MAG: dihydrodipicolinate reductase [Pseudomonadota bacterium]
MIRFWVVLAAFFITLPFGAHAFERVAEKASFIELVEGRNLTRLGIRLAVAPTGEIKGRAFGRRVSGQWQWSQDGYFCRDLYYGEQDLGPNCQMVEVNGNTVRFTSDKGNGIFADLRID